MPMSERISENIKAVFFDHDDTLVDTIGSKWNQHKFIASKYYGKQLTEDDLREHWGKPLEDLFRLFYDTDDVDQAMEYTKAHHEEFPKPLFPESVPTLRKLHAAGKVVGIITATLRFSFEHDLDLHNFPRDIIDYTQTADDTQYHKPDPRVFDPAKQWLAERSIEPAETLYVGDGLKDMKAALGAGFDFLGVESGLVTAEEFQQHGAESLASIAEVFKN
jgi:phosphoglycolate phosphatase-like HAD superfamily hydrolase